MDETEISTEELTLDQKIAILMEELPKPLQDFLRSPERDAVSSELSRKYSLHADQAGAFDRSYIYMLLGVYTPEEFVQELHDAGVPEAAVRGLTTDVNERVFKRLQNQERVSAPAVSSSFAAPRPAPAPVASVAPAPFVPPPAPRPYTPPVQPVQPMQPQQVPAQQIPASQPAQHAVPAIRTMAHDMQEMKEGHMPARQPLTFAAAPQATPVSIQPQAQPARSFQTSSVPNTAQAVPVAPIPRLAPEPVHPNPTSAPAPSFAAPMPAAPAPFAPPMPAQSFQTMPRPAAPVPHNLPGQNIAPIVKEYGVDPYRETPE